DWVSLNKLSINLPPAPCIDTSIAFRPICTHSPLPSCRLCIPFPPLYHLWCHAALQVLRTHQPTRKQINHLYSLIPSSCFRSQLPVRTLTNRISTFCHNMRRVQLISHREPASATPQQDPLLEPVFAPHHCWLAVLRRREQERVSDITARVSGLRFCIIFYFFG